MPCSAPQGQGCMNGTPAVLAGPAQGGFCVTLDREQLSRPRIFKPCGISIGCRARQSTERNRPPLRATGVSARAKLTHREDCSYPAAGAPCHAAPRQGCAGGAGHCAGSNDVARTMTAAHLHTEIHTDGEQDAVQADTVHAQHHSSSMDGEQSPASADPCTLCTATRSTTSFLGEPLSMAARMPTAGTSFPALFAPPPSHATEGPERPPRSA